MKRLSRLTGVLILMICLVNANPVARAEDAGYDITAYDINIDIGEDNVYRISETIAVNFRIPSRGIYRYIPLRQEMEWTGENCTKRVVNNTKVSSINVNNHPFTTYAENGNMVIRIGDPGVFKIGKAVYNISYEHALGEDKIDELDFVYYNLIGTQWDCDISGVTFSVKLPKDFDTDRIGFYSGAFGSMESELVEYDVSGSVISGYLTRSLRPGEGFTIRLNLPEGYFEPPPAFPWQKVFILASLILMLAALILFLLFGHDGPLPTPVEFYPPEGITSAEAGYVVDGVVDDKDVVSLVIFWASKGLIMIEQTGENDFILVKQKDITDMAHEYEKTLFRAIFRNGDTVVISELREKIYGEVSIAKSQIPREYIGKGKNIYTPLSLFLGKLAVFFAAILVFGSLFIALYRLFYSIETALIFSLFGSLAVMLPINSLRQVLTSWNGMTRAKRGARLTLSIIGMAVMLPLYTFFMHSQELFPGAVFVSAAVPFLGIIGAFMRKRTMRGSELLGRVLGFKNFLEVAEKERLELLTQASPSYFYDVLPYAYVFGVSEKWAKKFEGIAVSPPTWYTGYGGAFSPLMFNLIMLNSLTAMQGAMTARPVTTRSGFGGGARFGGGFSGGGFGGGGGGRW